MFIDLHCHIVPGVDDGAESIDEACEMIGVAAVSGTSVMCATPHYNNHYQGLEGITKRKIQEQYSILKNVASERVPSVILFLGCELFADDNISELLKNNDFLTINNSRYLLVEFNFDEKIYNVKRYVEIIRSFGLVPVIAHPERYLFFQENYNDISFFVLNGCLLQVNKDSPIGKYGDKTKNLSRWLLKNNFVHLFSGDSHSVNYRNPDMTELYEWLINYYSVDTINTLMHDNSKRILLDIKI